MSLQAPLPITSPRRGADLLHGPALLEPHRSSQRPVLSENPVEELNGADGNLLTTNTAAAFSGLARPPEEALITNLLRASGCLDEASAAMAAEQLVQACTHMEHASAILHTLIVAVVPGPAEEAPPAEPPVNPIGEAVPLERPRAIGAVA